MNHTRGVLARSVLCLAFVTVFAAGSGCRTLKEVRIRGVAPLNQTDEGDDASVRVYVYQLKSPKKFMEAPFDEIWADDRKVLEGVLVGQPVHEDIFGGLPGDQPKRLSLGVVPEEVLYIGVMARFRKEDDRGSPRRVVLTRKEAMGAVIEVTGYRILKRRR